MVKIKKIIFFDFDGVIADSFGIAFEIGKQKNTGIKSDDDFRNLFNGNINDWKKDFYGSIEEIKKIDDEFFALIAPKMSEVNLFPDMEKVIKELAKSHGLVVVSSTRSDLVNDFMERNGILQYFDEFGGDKIVHTNKTERIKEVFNKYGVGPDNCVFITDTLGDMREAANCGVSSIGVSWGYQKKENFFAAKPYAIVEKPTELLSAVLEYFKKAEV